MDRPKVVTHLDNFWGLRTGVMEWNSLHQNLQVIKFRSLCTVCMDPKKSVESLKIQDRIWLRTINIIISGSSKFSWNSAQSLTLQTGGVGHRRHRKSSMEKLPYDLSHTDTIPYPEIHRWIITLLQDKRNYSSHTSSFTLERPSFSKVLLTKQRSLNTSDPGRGQAGSTAPDVLLTQN